MTCPHCAVVITGWGGVEEAVKAIKRGAIDFLRRSGHFRRLRGSGIADCVIG